MNFDIAKEAKGQNRRHTSDFIADVNDSVLEISFYWAGKGCADDVLTLNGPLISAIAITPGDLKGHDFSYFHNYAWTPWLLWSSCAPLFY